MYNILKIASFNLYFEQKHETCYEGDYMDRQFLGSEIKRIREELNLTQKQVCEGICDQGVISKIERGEFFPSFEVLLALSNRLKLPINYFFESAISGQYYHVIEVKNEVDTLLLQYKYDDVFNIANRELQSNELLLGEHKQFFVWARTISASYLKLISFDECVDIIEQCLSEKIDYINQSQRMRIRNSLANLKARVGNFDDALVEYEKILLEFKSESSTLFYFQVMFNYANNLHNYGQVKKSLDIVNEALVLCKKVENLRIFGMLYFLKGECLIDLHYSKEEISKCLKKAKLLFEELNLLCYLKILKDNYSEFL
jgi:transcriptional regulator with XRE-family HTH domain